MKDIQKEIVPIVDEDLFIVLNHMDADFDYQVHYHPEYEINLVLNTYGERIVGDSIEAFKDIDLVMLGPNIPHKWCGKVVKGNHVITIQFSEQLLDLPIMHKHAHSEVIRQKGTGKDLERIFCLVQSCGLLLQACSKCLHRGRPA